MYLNLENLTKGHAMKKVLEINNWVNQEDPLTDLLREGAKKLIGQAIEAELDELLKRHESEKTQDGHQRVVRSGHHPQRSILTGIGEVSVEMPKVRSKTGEPVSFHSSLIPPYVRKSSSLQAALPWLYLQGVSTGKMQGALSVLLGNQAVKGLSPNVISRLKKQWEQEYLDFRKQDLSQDTWVYIWADGIHTSYRKGGGEGLCCLVVIGVNAQGKKKLLAVEDGCRESTQSWKEVLLHLKGQGMGDPLLGVGDGAKGFWAALKEICPQTRHQRCWVHKTKNVLNELPKSLHDKAKGMLHEIYKSASKDEAGKAMALFIKTFDDKYPKATAKLKNKEELLTFYDFPAKHWQSIRSTNPIESTFATIRLRTKSTRGCLSKKSTLSMIYKLGMQAEKSWRKLRGFRDLKKIIELKPFKDGVEISENNSMINNNQHAA